MNCFFHADTPAVAVCKQCGRAMCRECALISGKYLQVCPECCKSVLCGKIHKRHVRVVNTLILSLVLSAAAGCFVSLAFGVSFVITMCSAALITGISTAIAVILCRNSDKSSLNKIMSVTQDRRANSLKYSRKSVKGVLKAKQTDIGSNMIDSIDDDLRL